jgi:transcriptional regulator with XRE-family HTH domain
MLNERTSEMPIKFRIHLAELREKKGISRMEIVRDAKLSYQTVHAWENELLDNISALKIKRVMNVLGCTMSELVEIVGEDDEK